MYCGGLVFNLIVTDWIRTLDGSSGLSGRNSPDWLLQAQLLRCSGRWRFSWGDSSSPAGRCR